MSKRIKERFKKLRESSDKGFTLVELLVAIAILSIVVFPTMQVFITATKTNTRARTELQATITADSVLESAKSFSIYTFDNQCKKVYDSNGTDFKLLAGKVVGGSEQKFTSAAYGGTVGVVIFESDGKTVKEVKKNTSEAFKSIDKFLTGETVRYAYAINGIKQSRQIFDAVVIFEHNDELKNDTTISGSVYNSSDANSVASSNDAVYNYEFKISVYVYKHAEVPEYVGKNLYDGASDAIALINGSKLDSASQPK